MMKELEELNKLLSHPATIDRLARYMASIYKRSTSQNKKEEKQEISTGEVSRNLYNDFAAVSDQHTTDPMKNKNQNCIEKDMDHMTLHDDSKIEGKQVMVEEESVTLEQLHEDMVSRDASLDESSIASSYHGEESDCDLKVQNIAVDPSLSGAATSVLTTHVGGDILQWHDVITDLFENNNIMSLHSHEIGACDHEKTYEMISTIDGSPTPLARHENIKHRRTDFVYFGIKEVTRSEKMNEEWLQKAKEARLVAANARQHLQEVKEKVNLINIARQKRIEECVEEDMPSHLSQQLVHNNIHPIPDKNEGELVQQSQAIVKSKIDVDVGDTPRYDEHNNASYLLLPIPIYFHHEMHDMVEDEVFILEFVEPLLQVHVCEHLVEDIWGQVLAHLTGTGARLANHFSMFCLLCMTLGQNKIIIA
ncbi:hypothetical protein KI387_037284 [Taxus chinensis]|uniref:Uncharacterized protein n=1 Tax=Taxus chinensis TaxID=29808 RepID=A0AA38FV08_TAXCH|nr:hypothetical protein KI387_037284 [Taxus chinensis]